MKLNYDCIRDILLYVEETITYEKDCISLDEILSSLDKYQPQEVIYHINELKSNDYFKGVLYGDNLPLKVADLSPKGRAFLQNIRDNSKWNKIKKNAINLGCSCLTQLADVAINNVLGN